MLDWLFGRKQKTEPVEHPPADESGTPSDTGAPPSFADAEHLEAQMRGLNQQITELLNRSETLQEQLEQVNQRSSFGNEQLETLTRHLSDVADWAGPLDKQLAELATWAEQSHEELTQLEENIRKLSRTQFKTNSLAEAQQERLQTALETLQDLATRKQEAAEKARQRQREAVEVARREGRLAMATDLFPALDGLESALESGRVLLDQSRQPVTRPGFFARLAYAFGLRDLPATSRGIGDTQALKPWLDGLQLVRERFLALLKSEGIQPIRAKGETFDPHHHMAIEAVERADVPPGTVVEEHRPGYRLGDQVLRYAEVVVVRDGIEVLHRRDAELVEPPMAAPESSYQDTEPVTGVGEDVAPADGDIPQEVWSTPKSEDVSEAPSAERVEVPEKVDAEEGIKEPAVEEQVEEAPVHQPATAEEERSEPVEETVSKEAEETEEETSSQEVQKETHDVDPEVEKMIARFEARQQARQEN